MLIYVHMGLLINVERKCICTRGNVNAYTDRGKLSAHPLIHNTISISGETLLFYYGFESTFRVISCKK